MPAYRKKREFTEKEKDLFIKQVKSGLTYGKIARIYGVSSATISNWVNKYDLADKRERR